jgi:hypothetical protein
MSPASDDNRAIYKPSPDAVPLAQQFMADHAETMQFEIEYAAQGNVSLDENNRLVVHETEEGPATKLLNFMKAMASVSKGEAFDAEALKSGISLIGNEIYSTKEDAQERYHLAVEAEQRFRKNKKIPDGQSLTIDEQKKVEKSRSTHMKHSQELRDEADKLVRVQGDLLGVLKKLGINTHREAGGASKDISR